MERDGFILLPLWSMHVDAIPSGIYWRKWPEGVAWLRWKGTNGISHFNYII